jgi:hypothetical protein
MTIFRAFDEEKYTATKSKKGGMFSSDANSFKGVSYQKKGSYETSD